MNEPLFSIIVPVYNVEQYLNHCLESLVCQTYENIEIILVDDGSPDTCPQMCDKWKEKDSRIKVLHKKNGGLSDARNKGIKEARGKYIMFVDSDDYIDKYSCEKIKNFTQNSPDVICIDGVDNHETENLKHIDFQNEGVISGEEFLKKSMYAEKMPMAAWLYIYKREFLIENTLFLKKGILHEDEQFTPRVILRAKSLVNTGISAYRYNIRDNSITTKNDKRKNIRDFMSTAYELVDIYSSIKDMELQQLLLDSLVAKYLSMFQSGRSYLYGSEYIFKAFVKKYSFKNKTKAKAFLFCFSPKIYWYINNSIKNYGK